MGPRDYYSAWARQTRIFEIIMGVVAGFLLILILLNVYILVHIGRVHDRIDDLELTISRDIEMETKIDMILAKWLLELRNDDEAVKILQEIRESANE